MVLGQTGGINTQNGFAYCLNDPVNMSDSTGNWPSIKEKIKKFATKLMEPIQRTQEKLESLGDCTITQGVNGSAYFLLGGSVSLGYTFDTRGNIGYQITTCSGGGTPSASVSKFTTITNAPDINKLKKESLQVGGSGGAGVSLGVEYTCFKDDDIGCLYHGLTTMFGVGLVPAEGHGEIGYTWIPVSINVFDIIDSIYKNIIEW